MCIQPSNLDNIKRTLCLPPCWVYMPPSTFCKLEIAEDQSSKVTRSVALQQDLTWKAHVHGREIPHSNPFLNGINSVLDAASLQELITILHTVNVCCGKKEEQFATLVESKNGSISNCGVRSAYLDKTLPLPGDKSMCGTVRASNCDIISHTAQCAGCSAYRHNLRAMVSRNRVLKKGKG